MPRPIYEIANEIRLDWKPVNFAAKPYLEAMYDLRDVTDSYYQDSAPSIIRYFLANARSWRGPVAKALKAELNAMVKGRYASSVRSQTIRLASSLPAGNPLRRTLLRTVTAGSATRVDLQGITDGYIEGTRDLNMIGPLVSVDDWVKAMVAGEAEGYNAFNLRRVASWLKQNGIRKVMPARESSVALYAQVPSGLDIVSFADSAPAVDEFSVHKGYGTGTIGGYYTPGRESVEDLAAVIKPGFLIRLWWD